ncbi:MAG: signal peptidase II [Clostridia bacterium]|nr:signal peptidase II [Clostridia bacterium]
MAAIITFVVSVIVLVGADQWIKYIVETSMTVGETIPFIDWLVQWTYVQNRGASFGILQGQTWLPVIVTVVMMAVMVYLLAKKKLFHWVGTMAFALIISGGIGNLIDRLFKGGCVTDYIDISPLFEFPVFNLADCCITIGEVFLCIYILFLHEKYEKKAAKAALMQPEDQQEEIAANEA